jgi:HlyD family secretion protein
VKRVAILAMVACGGSNGGEVAGVAAPRESKVTRGDLVERVLVTGMLRAANAVDLNVPKTDSWQLTIRWMVEDGTRVKAGERVLELDNSAFTNGLRDKRLQLIEAENVARTTADLAAIGLANKDAEVKMHRLAVEKATLRASVPADLLTQREAQERHLDKTRMQAQLVRTERELESERKAAALEGRVKQLELEKARRAIAVAEKNIEELVLKAPADGVMLVANHPWRGTRFQVGDTVQPGFTLMTQPDLTRPMKVAAELSDVDDGKVSAGMKGTCTLDAYPKEPLPCTVEELAPVARSNDWQSLRRVFAVGLQLATSDAERMRPGMSVKVELPGPTIKGALLVPRGALVFDAQKAVVRLAGGELKEIKVLGCDSQKCAVEGTVSEGDLVKEGP